MNNNHSSRKPLFTLFSLAVLLSLLTLAVSPVLAKPLSVEPDPGAVAERANRRLSAEFHRSLTRFNTILRSPIFENFSLADAQKVAADWEAGYGLASNGKKSSKGFSINQYISLRANFALITNLQGFIKNLLTSHPGFDRYGNVTNSGLAQNTVNDLDKYLTDMQYYTNKATTGYIMLLHSR